MEYTPDDCRNNPLLDNIENTKSNCWKSLRPCKGPSIDALVEDAKEKRDVFIKAQLLWERAASDLRDALRHTLKEFDD